MHNIELMKEQLINRMTENLVLLRTSIGLTQEELSDKIGCSRFTLIAIEKHQRPMTWNTFLSLLLIFQKNLKSCQILEFLDIYSDELKDYLEGCD